MNIQEKWKRNLQPKSSTQRPNQEDRVLEKCLSSEHSWHWCVPVILLPFQSNPSRLNKTISNSLQIYSELVLQSRSHCYLNGMHRLHYLSAKLNLMQSSETGNSCFRSRDSNIFKISVNVAARSKIDFNLTYQELLSRRFGIYEHCINIDPGQVVRDLRIDVFIRESRRITSLKVPPIRNPGISMYNASHSNTGTSFLTWSHKWSIKSK